MKLLAIDSSSTWLSLALTHDNDTFLFHEQVGQKHAEHALPTIATLLDQGTITLNQLDAIVFGQGPGSFTGLRIACGLAQGLAFSANLPVIAIPTLDNIAKQASYGHVMVCMDARMGQVYYARYQHQPDGTLLRLTEPHVDHPAHVVIPPEVTVLAGNGFALYPDLITPSAQGTICEPERYPHALAHLALAKSGSYPMQPANEALLLYVRNKVALTQAEQQKTHRKSCLS